MSFRPPVVSSRGTELDKREIATAFDNLGKGRSNATGSFTVTLSTTTTIVTDPNVASDSVVFLSPFAAVSVPEIASTWVSAYADGSFTVTHPSNATAGRVWKYAIQG